MSELNLNPSVDGICLQRPLPSHLNPDVILQHILPRKDVEGLHPSNIANIINTRIISESNSLEWILNGGNNHIACLPMACIELLNRLGVPLDGADVVVIGRSNRVSLPLSLLLTHCNATVTTVHSSTRRIPEIIRRSTVVITSIGSPNSIRSSWLKPGAIVIDLGTTPTITDRGLVLLGDCDYEACKEVASFITPPGQASGLGTLSFAMMLRNIVYSATAEPDHHLEALTSQKFIHPKPRASEMISRSSMLQTNPAPTIVDQGVEANIAEPTTVAEPVDVASEPTDAAEPIEVVTDAAEPSNAAPETTDPYLQYGGSYAGDPKDTPDFKYITFRDCPLFTPAHKSAMSRHLSRELFHSLKDLKSNTGYTLSNVIMTGVVTPHLGVGATAGDEDCWEVFKPLFYPIIKDWHGYDAESQTHPMDLDPSKLRFTPEQQEVFDQYVVSTRIRAARNISGFALPAGATSADRSGVETVLKQAFDGLDGELAGKYYELGGLTDEQRNFLLEKGFLFQIPSKRNLLTGAGAARSWPDNRGIFHNDTQTALCWVNEEDHCRIISMEMGGNIPSVFQRFCALSKALEESATRNGTKLMWSEKLGFLGTCPSNLGTGLRASVMVCLPEFNKLLEGSSEEDRELLEQVCSAFDLQPRGSAGEHSAAVGAKFDISNKQRLGFSEVELVQKMIDGVSRVIEFEKLLASGVAPGDICQSLANMTTM